LYLEVDLVSRLTLYFEVDLVPRGRPCVSRLTSCLEVDLVAGLGRQEEAEERDGVDEQTREDEVDDVEQAAPRHVDRERHVRVRGHVTTL